jgi:hypothetical protein
LANIRLLHVILLGGLKQPQIDWTFPLVAADHLFSGKTSLFWILPDCLKFDYVTLSISDFILVWFVRARTGA